MKFEVNTQIHASKEAVWKTISDIEHSATTVSAIQKIEVLERPEDGLVGFKWRETRTLFGKEAQETMWITDAAENDFYRTRAESHGAVYVSRLSVTEEEGTTTLTISFTGEAQSLIARIMSVVMMPFFKGATIKALQQDLADIKAAIEASQ
jgi:hypothetical protein